MSGRGIARHEQYRPKAGTAHQRALDCLCLSDMETAALRAATRTTDTESHFVQRVLLQLWDGGLVDRIDKNRWRITPAGRIAAAEMNLPPRRRGQLPPSRFEAPPPAEVPLPPGIDMRLLTSSPGRARSMTEADKAPPPVRRDGLEFHQHPSRRGNRLYYRDGRVTDLEGNPLEVTA